MTSFTRTKWRKQHMSIYKPMPVDDDEFKKRPDEEPIVCSYCDGTGYTAEGFECFNCEGTGEMYL
jgi:RecJ-like exonuclease